MFEHADGELENVITAEIKVMLSLFSNIFIGPMKGSGKKAILEGLEQVNLYIALINDICVGFIWYLQKGAFHSFLYLHIILVKEEYRSKGIGKKLIDFFEDIVFVNASKIFLVVADFNPDAKRLYEKVGYRKVGEIPSIYIKGTTEYLMMKEKEI